MDIVESIPTTPQPPDLFSIAELFELQLFWPRRTPSESPTTERITTHRGTNPIFSAIRAQEERQ